MSEPNFKQVKVMTLSEKSQDCIAECGNFCVNNCQPDCVCDCPLHGFHTYINPSYVMEMSGNDKLFARKLYSGDNEK